MYPSPDAELWGEMSTLGASHNGSSVAIGSCRMTSSAAAPSWPERSASMSAASSTRVPRATFTKTEPGFIAEMSLRRTCSRSLRFRAPRVRPLGSTEHVVQRIGPEQLVDVRRGHTRAVAAADAEERDAEWSRPQCDLVADRTEPDDRNRLAHDHRAECHFPVMLP